MALISEKENVQVSKLSLQIFQKKWVQYSVKYIEEKNEIFCEWLNLLSYISVELDWNDEIDPIHENFEQLFRKFPICWRSF